MDDGYRGFQDDEEYVYLDETGGVQKKLELTVTWNSVPDKNMLVTVSKTIDESAGYSSLQRQGHAPHSISKQKGLIKEAVKSGDHLKCDLVSKDLWIDVQMQLLDLRLNLLFEVKVLNQARISEFANMLVSIANMYLDSIEMAFKYETSDLKIEKRGSDPEKMVKLLRRNQNDQLPLVSSDTQTSSPLNLEEEKKIEECFNFLDRKISCQMLRGRNVVESIFRTSSRSEASTPFMVMCDTDYKVEADISQLRAFPIRYFRKETMMLPSSTFELQNEDRKEAGGLNKGVCCCYLL